MEQTPEQSPPPSTSLGPSLSPKHKKRKPVALVEDDFFSLSSSMSDIRKHKKKHKKHKKQGKDASFSASPTISDQRSFSTGEMSSPSSFNVPGNDDIKSIPASADIHSTSLTKNSDSIATVVDEDLEVIEVVEVGRASNASIIIDDENPFDQVEASVPIRHNSSKDDDDLDFDFDYLDSTIPKTTTATATTSTSTTKTTTTTESGPPDKYDFSDANEKKRRYIIRITSKLPLPSDFATPIEFGTKGLKKFDKIHKSILSHFRTIFAPQLESFYLDRYSTELTNLVWIEGKTLIQPFYTPKTFRIPPPASFNHLIDDVNAMEPTIVSCLLIPRENSLSFLGIYPEFQPNAGVADLEDQLDEDQVEPVIEMSYHASSDDDDEEEEDEDDVEVTAIDVGEDNDEEEGFFVIGLKGKDNKRIEVKVSPETKLRNLLLHYLKKKEIDESTISLSSAKLIFDDEEMNLDDLVKDTELEQDFEIQVVL
ncbi:ESC2 [[Candida] subhashii]|uniref:ESC2 n=1 Tax=[Candida] subhashii TaxID=561895 RepID=A0A8J5QGC9_9ASCO|nr:ESC2 [[Candida] subhashii]KAG7665249.1 ESC2 [[Candida] subhashii]